VVVVGNMTVAVDAAVVLELLLLLGPRSVAAEEDLVVVVVGNMALVVGAAVVMGLLLLLLLLWFPPDVLTLGPGSVLVVVDEEELAIFVVGNMSVVVGAAVVVVLGIVEVVVGVVEAVEVVEMVESVVDIVGVFEAGFGVTAGEEGNMFVVVGVIVEKAGGPVSAGDLLVRRKATTEIERRTAKSPGTATLITDFHLAFLTPGISLTPSNFTEILTLVEILCPTGRFKM